MSAANNVEKSKSVYKRDLLRKSGSSSAFAAAVPGTAIEEEG